MEEFNLIEFIKTFLVSGVSGAFVLSVLAKIDWGGWFSKLLDKRIQESLAKNQASLDNKLYRTKALFDIEIVVLREVCTLMNTMSSKVFKVQSIEANAYLEGKQDYNELKDEIADANTSIDALMEYERFNYSFIEEEILEKLDDLIAKSREVVIAACYFANEYNEKGFSSLEDLDRVSEVSEINDIRKVIDGPTIYKLDIELRLLKLPESVDDGQNIADDCELLAKQIREYIVSLKII